MKKEICQNPKCGHDKKDHYFKVFVDGNLEEIACCHEKCPCKKFEEKMTDKELFKEETQMKPKICKNCGKDIEDWAFGNKDEDGNYYCMDCVSKLETIMEMEEYDE